MMFDETDKMIAQFILHVGYDKEGGDILKFLLDNAIGHSDKLSWSLEVYPAGHQDYTYWWFSEHGGDTVEFNEDGDYDYFGAESSKTAAYYLHTPSDSWSAKIRKVLHNLYIRLTGRCWEER